MSVNPETFDIGPCNVMFNGIDLGGTEGGVEVSVAIDKQPVNVDQIAAKLDERIASLDITVTAPLAEFTIENLSLAFPGSEIITDGTDSNKKKLVIKNPAGQSMLALAKALVLHPTDKAADDFSEDFKFTKAVPVINGPISYNKESKKIINLEFSIFYDAEIDQLGIFGDEAATA